MGAFYFAEFASHFPMAVMCALLGVSTEPILRLRKSLEAQIQAITMDRAAIPTFMAGYEIMSQFANECVLQREAEGETDPDSLLYAMIAAKVAGQLDERELRDLVMVLPFGGYDTSKNQLTMIMHLLIDRPEIYGRCAESLDSCTLVVKETLRHSSIATPVRQVQKTFVYDGFRFPDGAIVYLAAPLAGRDPERAVATRHVAFGRGPHMCIGQYLARNLLEEGLQEIARRLLNPRRSGDIAWCSILADEDASTKQPDRTR